MKGSKELGQAGFNQTEKDGANTDQLVGTYWALPTTYFGFTEYGTVLVCNESGYREYGTYYINGDGC